MTIKLKMLKSQQEHGQGLELRASDFIGWYLYYGAVPPFFFALTPHTITEGLFWLGSLHQLSEHY